MPPLPDLGREAALQAIYDRLPGVDCQGKCHASCGPIGASRLEEERMERAGVHLPGVRVGIMAVIEGRDTPTCPALTSDGRCSQYRLRPLVCRLWGVVEKMACPWGCRPDRWLTDAEASALLREVEALSGPGR